MSFITSYLLACVCEVAVIDTFLGGRGGRKGMGRGGRKGMGEGREGWDDLFLSQRCLIMVK